MPVSPLGKKEINPYMFVHEYQAKELLGERGLFFPQGKVAQTAKQAEQEAGSIEAEFWVVKAQILAGDRARFGGVKIARSIPEVGALAKELLGTSLVTSQTGASGLPIRHVYIERGCNIDKEFYLACVVDRKASSLVLLASAAGGTDVEDQPAELMLSLPIGVDAPPTDHDLAAVAGQLGLQGEQAKQCSEVCTKLHRAVVDLDATAIELNPLALTADGHLIGLDVKMELDDNASFRRPKVEFDDQGNEEPDRVLRTEAGYNFVQLKGNIGLLVSGAGLALATIDLVKLHGGEPANFLDLPPNIASSAVADACRRILRQSPLSALFVNVVGGGLTHCDTVAEGLIAVHRESPIRCPVVVRFAGTNKDRGIVLLKNARMPFTLAKDMKDAVDKLKGILGAER